MGRGNKRNKVGLRYGSLTVLEKQYGTDGDVLYKCLCDCGNTVVVKSSYLNKDNNSCSCGCVAKDLIMRKRQESIDKMVGKKFGRWTVIEHVDKPSSRALYFLCECDCGKTGVVSGSTLRQGKSKSCGCYRSEVLSKVDEMIGKRFGKLTVLSITNERVRGCVKYICQCDCGNITKVVRGSLTWGDTKSCGCLSHDVKSDWMNNYLKDVLVENTRIDQLNTKARSNNTSGRRGVHLIKHTGKWEATIGFKGKNIHLGRFTNFEDAVKARECAEEELWEPMLSKYGRTLE